MKLLLPKRVVLGRGIARRGLRPHEWEERAASRCAATTVRFAFLARCQVSDAKNKLAFGTTTTSARKPDGVVDSPPNWRTGRREGRTTDTARFSSPLLAGPQTRLFRLRHRTPNLKRLSRITEASEKEGFCFFAAKQLWNRACVGGVPRRRRRYPGGTSGKQRCRSSTPIGSESSSSTHFPRLCGPRRI